jgi:hypothetical protein
MFIWRADLDLDFKDLIVAGATSMFSYEAVKLLPCNRQKSETTPHFFWKHPQGYAQNTIGKRPHLQLATY